MNKNFIDLLGIQSVLVNEDKFTKGANDIMAILKGLELSVADAKILLKGVSETIDTVTYLHEGYQGEEE